MKKKAWMIKCFYSKKIKKIKPAEMNNSDKSMRKVMVYMEAVHNLLVVVNGI